MTEAAQQTVPKKQKSLRRTIFQGTFGLVQKARLLRHLLKQSIELLCGVLMHHATMSDKLHECIQQLKRSYSNSTLMVLIIYC